MSVIGSFRTVSMKALRFGVSCPGAEEDRISERRVCKGGILSDCEAEEVRISFSVVLTCGDAMVGCAAGGLLLAIVGGS